MNTYSIEILGTGSEFETAHRLLDLFHAVLPLPGASYLVAGDAARDALLAHNGSGDVAVTASPATSDDAYDVLAPASVIAAFIAEIGADMNLQFRWDEEAHLWCLSSEKDGNYHESDDILAFSEEDAVRAALAYVLLDQGAEQVTEVWP